VSFLNPALLAGALLFAVPLLIHLLNRQRHRVRPWAAMEFLLRAYQKQRNRLRVENLLLLLLRCLVPIVLALAIARPMLQATAGLLGAAGLRHHVVVLDATTSMGLREDSGPSPFERARTQVGRLLDRLERSEERNHKLSLITAGVRPRFLVRGDLDLVTARNQWFALQRPEDASGDLTAALLQAADALDEGGDAEAIVYVFTDCQQQALGSTYAEFARGRAGGERRAPSRDEPPPDEPPPDEPPPDDANPELRDSVREAIERLQQRPGTELHWIDVGPLAAAGRGGSVDNVQCTDLRLVEPAAVVRTPVEVVATLRNRSARSYEAEVTLEVDGSEPLRRRVSLPPGAEGEAEFQVSFREAGRRKLRATITSDNLEADDERYLSVLVRDRLRVLLIDGAAEDGPLRSYQHLWRLVLDPDPQSLPTFAVEARDTLALLGGQVDPADYDVTVLADVDRLNQRAANGILAAVRAGRGLLVTFGGRTEVQSFNLLLHAAGEGPMPFRLGDMRGGPSASASPRRATILAADHAVLREFDEPIYREVLQAVPIWRWLSVAANSLQDGATVIAGLDDAERSPVLIAGDFGDGKAVFLLSAPGSEYQADRWNRLHDPIVAFPLLHGLVRHLALPGTDPFAATVGNELTCALPGRPLAVEVLRPERDGGGRQPLADDPRPLPGGRYALPPLPGTRYAGFYTFELQLDREAGRENLSLPFAVNLDAVEGDLQYPAHDDLRQALNLPRILQNLPEAGSERSTEDRSDLGPLLLLLTLILVVLESLLARYVAVRRG
jgi:hypothetical protein